MENKTATEWLFEKLWDMPKDKFTWHVILEQAKEMEKEQMRAYIKEKYCIGPKSLEFHKLEFEQYYRQTYGNKNE